MKVVRSTLLRPAPFASSLSKKAVAQDPMAEEDDCNYEIFSKIWCKDARAVLDKRAAQAREMWQAEHDGRVVIESAHQSAAENKALLTQ